MKLIISVDVPEATTPEQAQKVAAYLAEYAPSTVYLPVEKDTFHLTNITLVSAQPSEG